MEGKDNFLLIYLGLVAVAIIIVAVMLLTRRSRLKNKLNTINTVEKVKHKDYFHIMYIVFKNTPILRHLYARVKETVKTQYPADEVAINKKVSHILVIVTAIFSIGTLSAITAGVFSRDIWNALILITLTVVGISMYISSTTTAMKDNVLKEFKRFLEIFRHYYHDSKDVERALADAIEEAPLNIGLHMERILRIIEDPDYETLIDDYTGTEPNKYVLMFLSLCASIKEFGDMQLPNKSTVLLTDLEYLKEEVNSELLMSKRNKNAFGNLALLSIAAIPSAKLFQIIMENNFDGIKDFYAGMTGIICIVIIFVLALISYKFICVMRDGIETTEKDQDIWGRIANSEVLPFLSPLLVKIVNKNYTKYSRYADQMRGIGDHTGPKAFLMKRVGYAIGVFVLSLSLITLGNITSRLYTLNHWTDIFEDTVMPSDEYMEEMEDVGNEYVHVYKNDVKRYESEEAAKEAIVADIIGTTNITNETYAGLIADEVIEKAETYSNTYFKWYELLIAIVLAVIGYNFPVWYLKFQKQVIEERKNDEIVRFQSIMLILMHMGGTSVETILTWIERFSYAFKESVNTCQLNLSDGIQEALQTMKDSEEHDGFKKFCDNLISIDSVGVENAFDEIESDRSNILKNREEDRNEDIKKKAGRAKIIVFVPIIAMIGLYVILPMGAYVLQMWAEMSALF